MSTPADLEIRPDVDLAAWAASAFNAIPRAKQTRIPPGYHKAKFHENFIGPFAPISVAVERRLPVGAVRLEDRPELENTLKKASLSDVERKILAGMSKARPTATADADNTGWQPPASIMPEEWNAARASPDCIVEKYLFAEVAEMPAAGGTGKTTLQLFEAVHIVLGLPLYGLKVLKPGPVLIITAEDSREMLVALLRLICEAMGLSDEQIARVMNGVLISDVSGEGLKLTEIYEGVVLPSRTVDQIIERARALNPVLAVFDPAVSFGVGESRVNDAEQGLIEAARRIRRALNCAVRYIHHVGKQNARDKVIDQYAGRGGSALPDGCRMVTVLQRMTPDEWFAATGTELADSETGLRLARPKLTYAPPQPDIFIRRAGYKFAAIPPAANSKTVLRDAHAEQIHRLLVSELEAGRRHSRNSLESCEHGIKRADLRRALDWLVAGSRVEVRDIPDRQSNRGAATYLHPVEFRRTDGEPKEISQKVCT